MDISTVKEKIQQFMQKYKIVIIILCIGLVLIMLPTGSTKEVNAEHSIQPEAEHISASELKSILSRIRGAGRVEVMLSVETTNQTEYQTDSDYTGASQNGSGRTTTVTVTDEERNENGLIRRVYAPTYRGAIIVCDGADNASVQLAVMNAVCNLTGLRTDQISVLKME